MKPYLIRQFDIFNDYPAVIALWYSCAPNIQLRESDSLSEIAKLYESNPQLLLVAECDGRIVGTLFGAFDGRRGMMYHLAVADDYRRQGIANELICIFEEHLRELGCIRYYLLVVEDNQQAINFYVNRGFEFLTVKTLAKNLI